VHQYSPENARKHQNQTTAKHLGGGKGAGRGRVQVGIWGRCRCCPSLPGTEDAVDVVVTAAQRQAFLSGEFEFPLRRHRRDRGATATPPASSLCHPQGSVLSPHCVHVCWTAPAGSIRDLCALAAGRRNCPADMLLSRTEPFKTHVYLLNRLAVGDTPGVAACVTWYSREARRPEMKDRRSSPEEPVYFRPRPRAK